MNSYRKATIILLLIFFMIASCQPTSENNVETLSPPTNTTFEATPLASSTTMPPITSSTPTLAPNLSAVDAEEMVLALLNNNNDCNFPCFWGIIPGETNERTTISFLHQFDAISPSIEISFPREDLFMSIYLTTQGGYNNQSDIVRWMEVDMIAYRKLETKNERVYGTQYYSEYFRFYNLPNLLTTYGLPDQAYVFLDIGIAEMGLGIDLYLLHLDYTDEGWVALLEMPLQRKDDVFFGCPAIAFTSLKLWSPGDSEPARYFGFEDSLSSSLFTIEEATGLTLDEFYQKFKEPTTACLETPADIHK